MELHNDPVLLLLANIRSQLDDVVELIQAERDDIREGKNAANQ